MISSLTFTVLLRKSARLYKKNLVLIKNIESQYLKRSQNDGTVLMGSFSKYRKIEGPGQDETEGTKAVDIKTQEPVQIKGNDLGKLVSKSYVKVQGPFSINIHGSLILNNANLLPDAYLFCTSLKLVKKFGQAHYKILNISKFGKILFDSLRKIDNDVFDWAHGRVEYGGAKNRITTAKQLRDLGDFNINEFKISDCFCKPIKYIEEDEYRFVFLTKKQPIPESTLVHNMDLVKCCSFNYD